MAQKVKEAQETKKKAGRLRTTRNLFDRKPGKLVQFTDPILQAVIGEAEQSGLWTIYGRDKNGKTRLALMMARDFSYNEEVAFISAEEGFDKSFTDNMARSGITTADKIGWADYMPIDQIVEQFRDSRKGRIIFIDNFTIYQDELKPPELKRRLIDALPGRLIIGLAHEERGLPYPALARMATKMSKVIIHVDGNRADVVSRYSIGGNIAVDEQASKLYWGEFHNEPK